MLRCSNPSVLRALAPATRGRRPIMHSPFPSTAKRMSAPTRQGASNERGRSGGASRRGWLVPTLVGTAAALGGAAIYNTQRARDAERRNPAIGRFLMVDGV